jgi:predicted metal-dependent phosphoesterase TrpH
MCTVPVFSRFCRESYNEPLAVYETLKRRGMDLVTVTDHDSIDALEPLRPYPDFFLSEEATCRMPSGTEVHVGVYDINERQHAGIQRRRHDMVALAHYLTEQRLFFSINHVFSALTGRRCYDDFTLFAEWFPGVETRNGQLPAFANRAASELGYRLGITPLGGSDAHTMAGLGRTYTVARAARSKAEFMEGLRRGRVRVAGAHGGYWTLTRAVLEIGIGLMRERGWARCLAPLMLAAPLVTLANLARELAFASKWSRRAARAPARAVGSVAW